MTGLMKIIKRISVFTLVFCIACGVLFSGCESCSVNNKDDVSVGYNPFEGVNTDKQITPLVENGKSEYKIVIPSEASECEKFSASQIQTYVAQSTGVTISVVADAGISLGDKVISVGKTSLAESAGLDTSNLNIDGFKIKTQGETVMIKGQRDRGTLYGAYDFLEKFVGVKFLTSSYEYVPTLSTISLYEADITEIPDFSLRSHYTYLTRKNLDLASKMRMISPGNVSGSASARYGGAWDEDWTMDMHSFNTLVDYNVYSEEHPEWFTDPDALTSGNGGVQPVLSNGLTDDGEIDQTMENSLLKQMIENTKQAILDAPDAVYVSLSQNDNRNFSNSDDCLRQRALFGGHAAHHIVFVNAIAKAIDEWLEEEGIDRQLYYVTYAYQYTFQAPDTTAPRADLAVPRDNVYVMVCPYDDIYNAPLSDTDKNFNFNYEMNRWAELTDNFFVFDYCVNFCDYLSWYPNMNVLKPNLEFYKQLGMVGVVSNGGYASYQSELTCYIFSKLMWDVDRDVIELTSEFNRYCFGEEAGKVMDEFVDFNNTYFDYVATKNNGWKSATIYREGSTWLTDTDTLNVDYLRTFERYLDKAKNIINDYTDVNKVTKSAYLNNLLRAEVMLDFMKFTNYSVLFSKTEQEDMQFYRSFYNKLNTLQITELGNVWSSISEIFAQYGIY